MTEFENLFDLLWQDRQENQLEEALRHDEEYKHAVLQAQEEVKKIKIRESFDDLEQVTSAYLYVSAEYGRVTYRQGLRDGIQLMKDLMDLS